MIFAVVLFDLATKVLFQKALNIENSFLIGCKWNCFIDMFSKKGFWQNDFLQKALYNGFIPSWTASTCFAKPGFL